jgi:hypothetical protein
MRNLTFPPTLVSELGVSQMLDITDQLPHNPAYTWAELAGARDLNDLTVIVLHHSGVPKSAGCTAERHATNHINGRAYEPKGEPGIPYHFYINNGQAYQVNDVLDRTYGVASNNAYTVHVCVEGEYYKTDQLSDADKNALLSVMLTVKAALPAFSAFKGHCELNPTDCPGYNYKAIIGQAQTLEQRLKSADTWSMKLNKVAAIVNEINYCNGLIKAGPDDGNALWAMQKQLELYDLMKQTGLL